MKYCSTMCNNQHSGTPINHYGNNNEITVSIHFTNFTSSSYKANTAHAYRFSATGMSLNTTSLPSYNIIMYYSLDSHCPVSKVNTESHNVPIIELDWGFISILFLGCSMQQHSILLHHEHSLALSIVLELQLPSWRQLANS